MAIPLVAFAGRAAAKAAVGSLLGGGDDGGSAQTAAAIRRNLRFKTKIEWFDQRVRKDVQMTMAARLRVATMLLRDRVVINISRPVTKIKGERSGRIKVLRGSRSKAGEFPKADTTRLMKDIFGDVQGTGDTARGIVGTSLDYGLILEVHLSRSFLQRTLDESRPWLTKILTTGRGGGRNIKFREDKH